MFRISELMDWDGEAKHEALHASGWCTDRELQTEDTVNNEALWLRRKLFVDSQEKNSTGDKPLKETFKTYPVELVGNLCTDFQRMDRRKNHLQKSLTTTL